MGDERRWTVDDEARALAALAEGQRKGALERASHGVVMPVGPETSVEAAPWFAFQTVPRGEWTAARELFEVRLPYLLPHFFDVRRHRDRKIGVRTPLFAGYLFARVAPASIEAVTALDGVAGVVGSGGRGRAVPATLIDAIAARLNPDGCVRGKTADEVMAEVRWIVGEVVEIGAGAFAGFQAIVAAVDSPGRIALDVGIFGRPTRVIGAEDDLDLQRVTSKPRRNRPGNPRR